MSIFHFEDEKKDDMSGSIKKEPFYDLTQSVRKTEQEPEEKHEFDMRRLPVRQHSTLFKDTLYFIFDVILNAVIIVSLVVLIRFYVISPFRVSGPSMCDTLNVINGECFDHNGEYIIVNKFLYRDWFGYQIQKPQRGDIVVFKPPLTFKDDFYIKRIVGLPGETVKIKDGQVYIFNTENPEGLELDEEYLSVRNKGLTRPQNPQFTDFTVPENHYFVLGDNRHASSDSRQCFSERGCNVEGATPYLPVENIEGKAWLVLWPFGNLRRLTEGTW